MIYRIRAELYRRHCSPSRLSMEINFRFQSPCKDNSLKAMQYVQKRERGHGCQVLVLGHANDFWTLSRFSRLAELVDTQKFRYVFEL